MTGLTTDRMDKHDRAEQAESSDADKGVAGPIIKYQKKRCQDTIQEKQFDMTPVLKISITPVSSQKQAFSVIQRITPPNKKSRLRILTYKGG